MTKEERALFLSLCDLDLLTVVVMSEARNQLLEGRIGVMCVARRRVTNKATWDGTSYATVILKDAQFSCFNVGDLNFPYALRLAQELASGGIKAVTEDQTIARETRLLAQGVLSNLILDNTGGADHYYRKGTHPWWEPSMVTTRTIGAHIFCKPK